MKRTTEDAITMGALVRLFRSAIGSTKGFDDLFPKTLDVVQEVRRYRAIGNPGGKRHRRRKARCQPPAHRDGAQRLLGGSRFIKRTTIS